MSSKERGTQPQQPQQVQRSLIVPTVSIPLPQDFEAWRRSAKWLLSQGISPHDVRWGEGWLQTAFDESSKLQNQNSLFSPKVPREFVVAALDASLHQSEERWSFMYQILWRIQHEDRRLMENKDDPDVHRLIEMAKAVQRDIHKLQVLVRFRRFRDDKGRDHLVAWYEPNHHVVERAAVFLARRYGDHAWTLMTPERCAHWDLSSGLLYSPGVPKACIESKEDVFKIYAERGLGGF